MGSFDTRPEYGCFLRLTIGQCHRRILPSFDVARMDISAWAVSFARLIAERS